MSYLYLFMFSVLQDYSVIDSLDTPEKKKETEEGTDVYFEILTNWGNPNYLGLTEVCIKICNSYNPTQFSTCIICPSGAPQGPCSFILIYSTCMWYSCAHVPTALGQSIFYPPLWRPYFSMGLSDPVGIYILPHKWGLGNSI